MVKPPALGFTNQTANESTGLNMKTSFLLKSGRTIDNGGQPFGTAPQVIDGAIIMVRADGSRPADLQTGIDEQEHDTLLAAEAARVASAKSAPGVRLRLNPLGGFLPSKNAAGEHLPANGNLSITGLGRFPVTLYLSQLPDVFRVLTEAAGIIATTPREELARLYAWSKTDGDTVGAAEKMERAITWARQVSTNAGNVGQ
jgi:hypothetical protein